MPCLLGCLALSTPRFVLLLVFLFTDYLGRAYESNFWPFLGFFFFPVTTLAYAVAMNQNGGQLSGWYVALFVLAVMMDLGVVSFGRRGRWRRRPPGGPGVGPGGGPGGAPQQPIAPRSIEVHGERVG